MYAKTFALLGGMASMASAHIKMTSPLPYGDGSLNNSPLEADGSDFPCKQRPGVYDAASGGNTYELGSSDNELAFVGTAVHGGGSCQVSITYDSQPDKNSVWKVIKSIEGGCPAQDAEGNIGNSADTPVPFKYSFDIPDDIPAGNGTIAWTWFNKVGNREMYMNCGPVTLTGDGGSESAYEALPDMFTANIGEDCGTESGTDVEFPDPGENVEKLNGATDSFAAPTGQSCGSSGTRPPNGGNDGGSGGQEPPTTTEAPTEPSGGAGDDTEDEDNTTTPPGGIFLPEPSAEPTPEPEAPGSEDGSDNGSDNGSGEEDSQPAPEEPSQPAPEEPSQPAPENPGNENGSEEGSEEGSTPPSGGEGGFEAGSACDTEGEWNCVGGSSFQRCASGSWSPVMELSGGTTCEPGQGANINMVVTRNGRTRPIRFRV